MDILANEFEIEDLVEWGLDLDWTEQEEADEDGEKEIDASKVKCKIIFPYENNKEVIDAFLKEMKDKYPELLYEVQIDD